MGNREILLLVRNLSNIDVISIFEVSKQDLELLLEKENLDIQTQDEFKKLLVHSKKLDALIRPSDKLLKNIKAKISFLKRNQVQTNNINLKKPPQNQEKLTEENFISIKRAASIFKNTQHCPFSSLGLPIPPADEYISALYHQKSTNEAFHRKLKHAINFAKKEDGERKKFIELLENSPFPIKSQFSTADCKNHQKRMKLKILVKQQAIEEKNRSPELFHIVKEKNIKDYFICQIKLKSHITNNEKLNMLFKIPEILDKILQDNKQKIKSIQDAKLLILTKLKELEILNIDKEILVLWINHYVRVWIRSKKIPKRISFSENCSIKKDCSSIYLNNFGLFEVENKDLLKFRVEHKWFFYMKNFDLIKSGTDFFVEVPYKAKNSSNEDIHNSDEFGQGMSMPSTRKLFDEYLAFIDKVNKAYYTPSLEKLEMQSKTGWAVSGGLPSLGKRR
ncbi:hypothetical protein CRG49_011595 [Neisseria sp. N95_16]|uniref:Uncharacterized protein n=1 Tax=Neisseria brasiliensis TaxID=2666100 RepID=A0A7X2GW32_9NEIS|nr:MULTISPECIES: hypothetical protein [Neisseria]MRN36959.1 hypothetical protein [Neisseria brasiliensis]PJO08694.1 hypothetical protein CRG49_011595 [Neisseria sp. N95_16]